MTNVGGRLVMYVGPDSRGGSETDPDADELFIHGKLLLSIRNSTASGLFSKDGH